MTARAVHWHEGMFLRPHHFQAAQRHWAHQSQRNDKLDHYFNWGLRDIDIDGDALSNYRFEVHSLTVRLRDGTMIEMPGDGTLPALDLKGIFDEHRNVTVYLALPMMNLAKANVAERGPAGGARYLVDLQELEDENTGVNPQPLSVRLLNFKYLLSTQEQAGYDVIPLARLQKSMRADATPELDESYIPPVLACDAWKPLSIGILRNLCDRIGKKVEVLATQMTSRGITLDSRGQGDAAIVAQLWELNEAYSRISIWGFSPGVHPFDAYVELAGLVGRLSYFTATHRPPDLPKYDHDDLGLCFYRVKQYLDEFLELMVEPAYKERPFIGTGLRMQVAIEPNWLDAAWEMYIGVHSPLPPEELTRLLTVPGQLDMKIGSSERVDTIYRLGQAGLQFSARPQAPNVLPSVPGLIYFQIRREQNVEWQNVQRSLALALRLNENRIAGNIQGQRVLNISMGPQMVPLQFTLYVIASNA
jgi:type VI secretion system protein ImpJ